MSEPERIGVAWRRASQRIDRLDARLLLAHSCACTHSDLIARPERTLSPAQSAEFETLIARRENGEPLAYLVGSAFLGDLEFVVTPAVLIPRPDTEVLIQQASRCADEFTAPRIVDLGTGSGVVAIQLAQRCPSATITAVDLSAEALDVARTNAVRHGAQIRFIQSNWYETLGTEHFDVIVSNPPYIADGDPHLRQNGLPFEPQLALTDGIVGGDGMACITAIIEGARKHLVPNGRLLIEHGYDQAVKVRQLLQRAGFEGVTSWCDEGAIERVSSGQIAALT